MKNLALYVLLALFSSAFSAAAFADEGKVKSYDPSNQSGTIQASNGQQTLRFDTVPGALKVGDAVSYMVTRGMEDGSTRAVIVAINGQTFGVSPSKSDPTLGVIKSYDAKSQSGIMLDPKGVECPFHFGVLGGKALDVKPGDHVKYVNRGAMGSREVMVTEVVQPPALSKPAPRGRQTALPRK
jgi:hypothetical protein